MLAFFSTLFQWYRFVDYKINGDMVGVEHPNQQAITCRSDGFRASPAVRVANTDREDAILAGERTGISHPRVERGFRHFHLELSKNGLPALIYFHIPPCP